MMTALIIAGSIALVTGGLYANDQYQKHKTINNLKDSQKQLKSWSGSGSQKELEAYLRDSMNMGYIDGNTYKNALSAYTKLRNNNYDMSKIDQKERKAVTKLYNDLYRNDGNFKSLWDKKWGGMSDDDKLAWLSGAGSAGATIPGPAYLDTSFDRYQKEVAPLKFYTNQELADLYNIDYNFDNIKKDYENAAEANVKYTTWLSDLLANNAERDNAYNQTSYLDSIRNVKSQAVQKGMSNGARAAAEVLAHNEAVQNKVNANSEIATQRFEAMNDALKDRAQTEINANAMYDKLAQFLSTGGVNLYANDVNRRGQDLLTNANILSADENLRSNRMAQNNLMSSIYNNVSAQNAAAQGAMDAAADYFKTISMPANGNDFRKALSDYIGLAYTQKTGYSDPMSKWGSAVNK